MVPPPIPTSFDDFSKKMVRSFDQVKQFAAEKMGTAEETTNFPSTYQQLDQKVDKLKGIFDGLVRTTRQMLTADDYNPPIGDSLMDAMDKINVRIERLRNRPDAGPAELSRLPPTIQQATANICLEGAELLARDTVLQGEFPAADLLQRYGQIQAKLSEARQEFNHTLLRRFIEPFSTYAGAYENVNRARRAAQRVRLELDAGKARLRSMRGPRPQDMQNEVDMLEKEFAAACDEATQEMKTFIQYTEATHCIQALIQAQLAYHRKAGEILAALQ